MLSVVLNVCEKLKAKRVNCFLYFALLVKKRYLQTGIVIQN